MRFSEYKCLEVGIGGKVVTAVIDNPPLNLLSSDLFNDLDRFTQDLEGDPDALVVVFKSRNPEFFIAHAEFSRIYQLQAQEVAGSVDDESLNDLQVLCERTG